MNSSQTLALTEALISKASVTPCDEGCQELMIARLAEIGFEIHRVRFEDVDNFWAIRGEEGPIFAFAGHTDVVPSGNPDAWRSPPFKPSYHEGKLYGRGAADMKGSLAAMITATERFVREHPDHKGRIAFLITSDEEGIAVNGTRRMMQWLDEKNFAIDYCLVGEPSSTREIGDVVKIGRRGSLGCELTILGKQGHVAYPHLAQNPVHLAACAIDQLAKEKWDKGNASFPPTSFQISNIQAGTGANNVIPGELSIVCNFRFSTESTADQLKDRLTGILDAHKLRYKLEWNLSGEPFLTKPGQLIDAVEKAITKICELQTELSTAGGTSDGRFIAPTGAEVVELGPVNATIHQIDEHVDAKSLDKLSLCYEEVLAGLLN